MVVDTEDQVARQADPNSELVELLRRNYRRTTWTLIVAIAAVILSAVSIVISVAAFFVLATPGLMRSRGSTAPLLPRRAERATGADHQFKGLVLMILR